MSALLRIGDFVFEVKSDGTITPEGIAWSVSGLESSRKVDEKAGEKEDDATVTDKGREPRKFSIKLSWNDDVESNVRASPIIEALDPSNPKPGDPPQFHYVRNGLNVAKLKGIKFAKVKSAKGPDVADNGSVTYELTCSSWARPKPSPGAGTPKDGKKFVLGSELGKTVGGFGSNNNTVGYTKTPKPGVPAP